MIKKSRFIKYAYKKQQHVIELQIQMVQELIIPLVIYRPGFLKPLNFNAQNHKS